MTVHPRACGELWHWPGTGSSSHRRRFIPARAGNSEHRAVSALPSTVHPRACGELYTLGSSRRCVGFGSSPRVRGTPALKLDACEYLRDGSSPRVRGTRLPGHVGSPCRSATSRERFIPARAGNSPTRRWCGCGASDDGSSPRVRGTPVQTAKWQSRPWCGSSPRVRGTPNDRGSADETRRFIPARAGNSTDTAEFGGLLQTVHPRACGELFRRSESSSWDGGSSPRVRGTLFLQGPDNKGFFRCQRAHQLILICSWVVCEMAQTGKS